VYLMLVLALGSLGCIGIKKPSIQVESVQPYSVTPTSVVLNVKVKIDNPNPIGAHLTMIDFDIYYLQNGAYHYLGHGVKKDVSIKANGVTEITIPVKIDDLQAIKSLVVLAKNGAVTLKVKGTAYIDLKITSFGIPFEQVEKISI